MPRVFIPYLPTRYDAATDKRVPSIDINPAAQYGAFEHLLTEAEAHGDDPIGLIAERIKARISPQDYILAIGDVSLIAAALCYANDLHGTAHLLQWEKRAKRYKTVEVSL